MLQRWSVSWREHYHVTEVTDWRMVMLQRWSVSWREHGHVTEVTD